MSFPLQGVDEISRRIESQVGIKAVTTSTAVVDALHALRIQNVVVAAPYPDDVNRALRNFLDAYGFNVVNIKGLRLEYEWDIGNSNEANVLKHAKSAMTRDADGLFILCTGHLTVGILESLEEDLGKPFISANQATIWKALALAGISDPINGLGSLMKTQSDQTR